MNLQSITPITEQLLRNDKMGFQTNWSTCDQVLVLTKHIKNGFQEKKMSSLFLTLQ